MQHDVTLTLVVLGIAEAWNVKSGSWERGLSVKVNPHATLALYFSGLTAYLVHGKDKGWQFLFNLFLLPSREWALSSSSGH